MSKTLRFTEESSHLIAGSLARPHVLNYGNTKTSRLLTRQIKQVVYELYRTTMDEVLDELGTHLNKNKKPSWESWSTALCVVLILCMVAELVQIATDVHVVRHLNKSNKQPRRDSLDHCQKLDDIIAGTIGLFHLGNKSHKPRNNPIENRKADLTSAISASQEVSSLVEKLRVVIDDNCK